MSDTSSRLYLVAPFGADPDRFGPALAGALAASPVAAVLVRLAEGDPRTQVNTVKTLAALVQAGGAALVVSSAGLADPVAAVVRGGADGLHAEEVGSARALREALPADRILGVGGLRTRDDAMAAGEAGADYLLFGEARPDGYVPPLEATLERAGWWAEIFETPCVAFAGGPDAVAPLGETGAEFVALGEWVWADPDGAARAVAGAATRLRAVRAVSA